MQVRKARASIAGKHTSPSDVRILKEVKMRNPAKASSTGRNDWMATSPAEMKAPRSAIAPAIPYVSTRFWNSSGTLKYLKSRKK